MNIKLFSLFIAAMFVLFTTLIYAAEVTITGELIDTKCFSKMGAKGEGHASCAVTCAKSGIPVAVMDDSTKKLHVLAAPAPALSAYMSKTVKVTGELNDATGIIVPSSVEIKEGDTWKKVDMGKGMM